MSSSAPCAPSNSSDSPRSRARLKQPGDVGDHRRELRRERECGVARRLERHGVALEVLREHEVVEFEQRLELGREAVGIEQVLQPDRPPRDLVFVRGADAATGGADLGVSHRPFPRLVERDVVGQHQRTGRRDLQARANFDPRGFQLADLLQQRRRRQYDAIADVHRDARTQDARRDEPQHRLLAADDERVAGIVPALEAHDALRLFGQPVDDLALAFIAPLGTDDDDVLAHAMLILGEYPRARCAGQWSRATTPASWRRSKVNPVAGRARPNALPMPS